MTKQVLFIQGGGDDGYAADLQLVASLQHALGDDYEIIYPQMPEDDAAPDFGWPQQIGEEMGKLSDGVILVGHSLGASMLLKYLSENEALVRPAGIFLIATPYWKEEGLKLQEGFGENLPGEVPIFFYQCRDDEVVPFDHFEFYRHQLPWASFRDIESGGHQLDNDLALVAKDIITAGQAGYYSRMYH